MRRDGVVTMEEDRGGRGTRTEVRGETKDLHAHAHAATGTDQPPLSSWAGGVLLALATLPWCWRHHFPVNHFSANWSGTPKTWTAWLYRIKKWQYLLYKHCLLHGLNLSVALPGSLLGSGGGGAAGSVRVVHTRHWQLYWLSLNSAYVMEFFLQTCALSPTTTVTPSLALTEGRLSPDLHAQTQAGAEEAACAEPDAADEPAAHGHLHRRGC